LEKEGLLSDTIRARITSIEYDGIKKEDIEKLYIQEYGELPPNFDIIKSKDLKIGKDSGFNATAIHFYDEEINEVYFINRGTEADIGKLRDGLFNKLKDYRKEPEKLKEIVFNGNEDIYTDIYTVLLGEDQFSSEDNIDFTNKVIDRVDKKYSDLESTYFSDGHSLGGSEVQNIMIFTKDLFTNVNVYNDAPMNIYNTIMVNDHLKKKIQKEYGITAEDINDLKKLDLNDLRTILDQEYNHYSNKITYYRNEDDLLTTLKLPYEYRLIDAYGSNVKTFKGHPDAEMIDLVGKYPNLAMGITFIIKRANKEGGIRTRDIAALAAAYSVSMDSLWSFIGQIQDMINDIKSMGKHIDSGHSMDKLIERMANEQGRMIVGNEEIYLIADSKGNKNIRLNIDETYRFYKTGLLIMEDKQRVVDKLMRTYEYHLSSRYDRFRRKVRQEMDHIENYPHTYLSASDRYTHDAQHIIRYKNLRFIENPPFKTPMNVSTHLEGTIHNLQKETLRQEKVLETYKDGILKLVEADQRVALLFTTYLERRDAW
jgi:hypothetical protein